MKIKNTMCYKFSSCLFLKSVQFGLSSICSVQFSSCFHNHFCSVFIQFNNNSSISSNKFSSDSVQFISSSHQLSQVLNSFQLDFCPIQPDSALNSVEVKSVLFWVVSRLLLSSIKLISAPLKFTAYSGQFSLHFI